MKGLANLPVTDIFRVDLYARMFYTDSNMSPVPTNHATIHAKENITEKIHKKWLLSLSNKDGCCHGFSSDWVNVA